MREVRVLGLSPSRSAAPSRPEIFPFATSSARRIFLRSRSRISVTVRIRSGLCWSEGLSLVSRTIGVCSGSARSRFNVRPSLEVMTARSMTFSSSRIFPGQSYPFSLTLQSSVSRRDERRLPLPYRDKKASARRIMSSLRSLSGGMCRGNTFNR